VLDSLGVSLILIRINILVSDGAAFCCAVLMTAMPQIRRAVMPRGGFP
jgi:hypothetical protein